MELNQRIKTSISVENHRLFSLIYGVYTFVLLVLVVISIILNFNLTIKLGLIVITLYNGRLFIQRIKQLILIEKNINTYSIYDAFNYEVESKLRSYALKITYYDEKKRITSTTGYYFTKYELLSLQNKKLVIGISNINKNCIIIEIK